MRLNFLIALRASFAHMKRLFPRGRGSVRVPHSCFLPLHSLRSAPVSRSPGLATRGGIPALKRPVSRPPSADADHLEGIYPGAVFLLASSRGAARRPESLGGPAVFGLISSFVGKDARLDRPLGWWIVLRVGFIWGLYRILVYTCDHSAIESRSLLLVYILQSLRPRG